MGELLILFGMGYDMHSDINVRETFHLANDTSSKRLTRSLNTLLRAALRPWRQRKMIATFESMDDWTLSDIGMHRENIGRMVDSFEELRLPQPPPHRSVWRRDRALDRKHMN